MIKIDGKQHFDFFNNVDHCVGTGRIGLALTAEYLDELEFVQREIGFKFIRGHGLFCDDVAIYQEYEEDGVTKVEYNYTYIDRIFDSFLELDIRPYLELGFMPYKMASGTQTIFYWKGNTTPPKDYSMWTDMVVSLLKHLRSRYGDDVLTWPIEVWNEPNLPGFWYKADLDEYLKLFGETYKAIKAYDERFMVGGPAVCGVKEDVWVGTFLKYCRENGMKPDNITRHHYTIQFPTKIGHYDYSKLEDPIERLANLKATRDLVDTFEEYKGTPIHITEFNTSYTPRGVIHDTNMNAACIAEQLAGLGDVNESYSYWTFGDVFEETGVPFSLFHGGFGMVAAGCIPKPVFWTFSFFKQLKDRGNECGWRDADSVVIKTKDGYAGIMWNKKEEELTKEFTFAADSDEYTLITKNVDMQCCNPLKIWHDLGEPAYPDNEQTELIRNGAYPLIQSSVVAAENKEAKVKVTTGDCGVIFFELKSRTFTPDRGYDYDRVLKIERDQPDKK